MRAGIAIISRRKRRAGFAAMALAILVASSCASVADRDATRLQQTAALIQEVKSFGRTLGIEPTEALSRTTREGPAR